MQDMQRYFLKWDKVKKMSPDNQVKYYKFLLNLVARIEEMQPQPRNAKEMGKRTAMLDYMHKLINLIQPQAHAQYPVTNDASIVGKMCVYGGSASTYMEFDTSEGKRYWCTPQGNNSCAEPFHTDCGATNSVFKTPGPKGGGPLCVPTFPENNNGSLQGVTARCVAAFEARLGGSMDQVVKTEMQKIGGNKQLQDQWNRWVEDMKKAVSDLETTAYGGISLKDYCKPGSDGRYNALNHYKQHEECEALARLFASVRGSDVVVHVPPPQKLDPKPAPKGDSDIYAKCHDDKTHPELGELNCASCAIRVLGPQMGSKGDASKWIATLAVAAQNYQTPPPGTGAGLQQRVIEMLTSASYCTDSEYPGGNYAAHKDKVSQWIRGPMSESDHANFLDAFGYYSKHGYGMNQLKRNLGDFKNSSNDGNNGYGWQFVERSAIDRRRVFHENLKSFGPKGFAEPDAVQGGLVQCTQSAARRLASNPAFNYCRGSDKVADMTHASNFCSNVARACGLDTGFCQSSQLLKESYKYKDTKKTAANVCPSTLGPDDPFLRSGASGGAGGGAAGAGAGASGGGGGGAGSGSR